MYRPHLLRVNEVAPDFNSFVALREPSGLRLSIALNDFSPPNS